MANLFTGMSQTELEAALAIARSTLLSGGSIISTTSGDVSVTKQPDVKTNQRVQQILWALSKLDPEKYPPEECALNSCTRIAFT